MSRTPLGFICALLLCCLVKLQVNLDNTDLKTSKQDGTVVSWWSVATGPIISMNRKEQILAVTHKKRIVAMRNCEKLISSLQNVSWSSVWAFFILIFLPHTQVNQFLPSWWPACHWISYFLGLSVVACWKMWLSLPRIVSENKLRFRNSLVGLISLFGQTGEAEGVRGYFQSFL